MVHDSGFQVQHKKILKLCVSDMEKIDKMLLNNWKWTMNDVIGRVHEIISLFTLKN